MQLNLFTGEKLRDQGIARSIKSANNKHEKWSDKAYMFLVQYIKTNAIFMTEDVRSASIGKIEIPPSNRAWGGVIKKAKSNGLIKSNGFRSVKNPLAHCTPATLWIRR